MSLKSAIVITNEDVSTSSKSLTSLRNIEADIKHKNSLSVDDFSTVCRTCLNKRELVPIFKLESQENDEKNTFFVVNLLKDCATIQVKQADDLPQNICHICLTKLRKIHGFQRMCILNESLLKSIFVTSLNQWNHEQLTSLTKFSHHDEDSDIDGSFDVDDDKAQNYSFLDPYCALKPKSPDKIEHIDDQVSANTHKNNEHFGEEPFKESHCTCYGHNSNKDCPLHTPIVFQENTDVITGQFSENEPKLQVTYLCQDNPSEENQKINNLENLEKCHDDVETTKNYNSRIDTDIVHEKSNKSDKSKEFKCTKCVLTFKTREDYLIHRRVAKHTKNPLSNCEVCNKLFLRCKLKLHMRTHTKEKPYECQTCLWKFNQKGNLERHMKKHNREKAYVCHLCGRSFVHLNSLENHKKIHEQKTTAAPTSPPKPVPLPSSYNFTCQFCGRFFKRKDPFGQHLRRHHADKLRPDEPSVDEPPEEKRHTCDTCGKTFKDKQGLKVHSLTHGEKQQLCPVCGKSFYTQSGLKTHLRIHTGERPYGCAICRRRFANKTTLDSHTNTHMGVRPYGCETCGKRFRQHQHLTAHARTHTGERPFSCSFCQRSFALKSTARVHERTHTGETPYRCEVCGKGFNDRSTRNKHRKHNHSGTEGEGKG